MLGVRGEEFMIIKLKVMLFYVVEYVSQIWYEFGLRLISKKWLKEYIC